MRFLRSLQDNLFGFSRPETRGDRIFFRLFELFVVYATLDLAWSWAFYTQRIGEVVLPLGIAQYVDMTPFFGTDLALWNAGFVSIFALLGFLRVWRGAYLVSFLLLHVQYAARYVLGEIPHSANLLGMTLLGLALAMMAFRNPTRQRRFTLGFAYFYIGLAYTLAGFCKLIGTGLLWADGRHLWLWIYEKGIDAMAKTGALDFNVVQELALESHPVATAFLLVGMLTEFAAVLMWWRRFRYPVVLAVFGLHVGILLSMGILFKLSMIELALLGLPWAAWIDKVQFRVPSFGFRGSRAQET